VKWYFVKWYFSRFLPAFALYVVAVLNAPACYRTVGIDRPVEVSVPGPARECVAEPAPKPRAWKTWTATDGSACMSQADANLVSEEIEAWRDFGRKVSCP
jgi:hypothetical protein